MATALSASSFLESPRKEIPCPRPPAVRTFRTVPELQGLKKVWASWHRHPNSSLEFFLMQVRLRQEIARPHVIVVYRDGIPDCILAGWLWSGHQTINLGGAQIALPKARTL